MERCYYWPIIFLCQVSGCSCNVSVFLLWHYVLCECCCHYSLLWGGPLLGTTRYCTIVPGQCSHNYCPLHCAGPWGELTMRLSMWATLGYSVTPVVPGPGVRKVGWEQNSCTKLEMGLAETLLLLLQTDPLLARINITPHITSGPPPVFWKMFTTPNFGVCHFCSIKTVELANIC